MKDRWIEKWNTLIWWPKHIKDHVWWMGQIGIYRNMSVGPWLWYHHKKDSPYEPFDLRCNCCFVCSWLLRVFIRPIIRIIFRRKKFQASNFNLVDERKNK